MRFLLLILTATISAAPALAAGDYVSTDNNRYYRMTFPLASGMQLTAGVGAGSDIIEYNRISPPEIKHARHYLFTASIDQIPLSLHSRQKIIKAEFLTSGSVYISGEGPIVFLPSIQTHETWRELFLSDDGHNVALDGINNEKNVTLPTITSEEIVAATRSGVARDFVPSENLPFWLGLAKECHVENGTLTGACSLYVREATIKLTFEYEEPIMLTIHYIIGC